tara:strand:- start:221 stop:1033 length:813 start_codon:yes stop_codon:yes gene_type:complete
MKIKKKKILMLSGNLIKHKYVAIKLLKKYKSSRIIFEKYPKNVLQNYSNNKSNVLQNHFKNVQIYEKRYFQNFCNKNDSFLKKKIITSIKKGDINSLKVFKAIKKFKPSLIIVNATSIINKRLVNHYTNKIVNIHQGLMPYYRGTGTNVWTFYNKELQYTGITVHFINEKIDDGNILSQVQSNFSINDNTHSIGCKNAKLSADLVKKVIDFLIRNPNYKGKKLRSSKNKIFFKKDFNDKIVLKVNNLIKKGLVKKYLSKKTKKIKLINSI